MVLYTSKPSGNKESPKIAKFSIFLENKSSGPNHFSSSLTYLDINFLLFSLPYMTGFKKRGPSPGTIFVKTRYQDICHAIPFSGSKFFVEFISGSKNTNRSLLNEISIFHTFLLYKSYRLLYRI